MYNAKTRRVAKSGLTFLFAYQQTVAQEIGVEQAMALHYKMVQAMGTAQGKAPSRQVDDETPPELAAAMVSGYLEQALGMKDAAIEALCRGGSIPYMDAIVKQLNPDLAYDLSQFRPSADAPCIEVIAADG